MHLTQPRHHEMRGLRQMLFGQLLGQIGVATRDGIQNVFMLVPDVSGRLVFDQHFAHHALRVGQV